MQVNCTVDNVSFSKDDENNSLYTLLVVSSEKQFTTE